MVQTYEGNKQIKDLTTNDLVYSFNEKEHKIELKKILFSGKTQIATKIVEILFDNGQTIRCTPNHPFAVRKNKTELEYISAKDLTTSMCLIMTDSNHTELANHKVISVTYLETKEDVYDIEVEDNHNFFVGGSDGILVHNCGKQVKQFRALYGIIKNVSDRPYVSNSFHCHVTENISPIEKQDKEARFWELFNGGKIQYCRYHLGYNIEAIRTIINRAMELGFYEGVNLSMDYCDDCGYEQVEMGIRCPKCGGIHITQIDRMNGYLGFSRIGKDTREVVDDYGNTYIENHSRFSPHKQKEIKDRISM